MIDKLWEALNTDPNIDIGSRLNAIQTLIETEIENFRADDGKVYNKVYYIYFNSIEDIQNYPLNRLEDFIDKLAEGNTLVDGLKLIACAAKYTWGAKVAEVTLFESFILVNIYYDDDWHYLTTIDIED